MSRRQFDDYDAQEWREEHERADKERRKREAKKQRHHLDDDEAAAREREAPGTVSGIPPAGFAALSRARPARTKPASRFVAILAARWPDGSPLMSLSCRFGRISSRDFFPGEGPWPTSTMIYSVRK
jgi:hypothetical protein